MVKETIVKYNKNIKNELTIMGIIKSTIKNYKLYFYFYDEIIPLQHNNRKIPYIVIKYMDKNIVDYFLQLTMKEFVYEFINMYRKLIESIRVLNKNGINHNDISLKNIMYCNNEILLFNFKKSTISTKKETNLESDYVLLNKMYLDLLIKLKKYIKCFFFETFFEYLQKNINICSEVFLDEIITNETFYKDMKQVLKKYKNFNKNILFNDL